MGWKKRDGHERGKRFQKIKKHKLFTDFLYYMWCRVPQAIYKKWQAKKVRGGLWEEV